MAIQSGSPPAPATSSTGPTSLWLLPRGEILLGGLIVFFLRQPVGAGGKAAPAVVQIGAALLPVGLLAMGVVQGHLVAAQQRLVILQRIGVVDSRRERHGVAGIGRCDLEGRHLRGQ